LLPPHPATTQFSRLASGINGGKVALSGGLGDRGPPKYVVPRPVTCQGSPPPSDDMRVKERKFHLRGAGIATSSGTKAQQYVPTQRSDLRHARSFVEPAPACKIQ
jgi:hypothetical protein